MTPMARDDDILRGLTDGPAGSAELAARTGLSLSSVKRGLRHLISADYVFAPEWGTYRLTSRGRAVCPELVPAAPRARAAQAQATPRPLDRLL